MTYQSGKPDRDYRLAHWRLAKGYSLAEMSMISGLTRDRVSQIVLQFMRANDLQRGLPQDVYEAWFNRQLADQIRAGKGHSIENVAELRPGRGGESGRPHHKDGR